MTFQQIYEVIHKQFNFVYRRINYNISFHSYTQHSDSFGIVYRYQLLNLGQPPRKKNTKTKYSIYTKYLQVISSVQ